MTPSALAPRWAWFIERCLDKYRGSLGPDLVQAVNLCGTISVDGRYLGGAYLADTREVFVAVAGRGAGDVERVLHAEISSLALRRAAVAFPYGAWASLRGDTHFKVDGGLQAIRDGLTSGGPTDDLLRRGYLSHYACTSDEEDYNAIAAALMTGASSFQEARANWPVIESKARIVESFYADAMPGLTRQWLSRMRPVGLMRDTPRALDERGAR